MAAANKNTVFRWYLQGSENTDFQCSSTTSYHQKHYAPQPQLTLFYSLSLKKRSPLPTPLGRRGPFGAGSWKADPLVKTLTFAACFHFSQQNLQHTDMKLLFCCPTLEFSIRSSCIKSWIRAAFVASPSSPSYLLWHHWRCRCRGHSWRCNRCCGRFRLILWSINFSMLRFPKLQPTLSLKWCEFAKNISKSVWGSEMRAFFGGSILCHNNRITLRVWSSADVSSFCWSKFGSKEVQSL